MEFIKGMDWIELMGGRRGRGGNGGASAGASAGDGPRGAEAGLLASVWRCMACDCGPGAYMICTYGKTADKHASTALQWLAGAAAGVVAGINAGAADFQSAGIGVEQDETEERKEEKVMVETGTAQAGSENSFRWGEMRSDTC